MIEALVLPKSNYVSLSECVYELIAISHPQDGEAMVSLLKGRGRLWRVHDSPEWIRAVHKEKAAIYEAAIRIEAEIEEMLFKCLRAGCVHGRGSDRQGTRCNIDEEDWSKCHINIEKNALFAPMVLSNYRSLWNVQVRLKDVFKEFNIAKPVNTDKTDAYDDDASLSIPKQPPSKSTRLRQQEEEKSDNLEQLNTSQLDTFPLDLKIKVVVEWINYHYPLGLRGVAQKIVAAQIVADAQIPFDKVSVTAIGRALRLIRSRPSDAI